MLLLGWGAPVGLVRAVISDAGLSTDTSLKSVGWGPVEARCWQKRHSPQRTKAGDEQILVLSVLYSSWYHYREIRKLIFSEQGVN